MWSATESRHEQLWREDTVVLLERLATRTTNGFGRSGAEREWVLADVAAVEPLLRATADVEIDPRAPVAEVADRLVEIARTAAASGRRSP
ncbi:hypothetical protein GCM10027451_26340 [Geodermatophilus aquaeductus]|uniref:Uncharacterized protein n=1 Tax=Geodermatophilus aquaeductus TaxID=1564161 RepID=A0A521EJP3_9ACTN|nr:hypothetical protein [Geodermatophilus aquaeductus]SMO84136.1 hypothetical protein SAMN06273567_105185 [Geodermatophilus aquaeductus]